MVLTRKQGAAGRLDRRAVLGLSAAGAASAACATGQSEPWPPASQGAFRHGVASGDPLADRVVLWTRVTVDEDAVGAFGVDVSWDVAEDDAFTRIVQTGEANAGPGRDWTVKVDVAGLAPAQTYFYRFTLRDERSPIGRTKTLPQGPTSSVRIAAFSCSNYQFGFFNAYRHMAEGAPVDLVLHLGDYFYEYGGDGYGGARGAQLGRLHQPPRETVTLADYRLRHAQYKADPDLQVAHAAAPWITIWDDHESANDAHLAGAENHNPATEGEWSARKTAAVRAYFEWMPIREPEPGRAREAIWRRFEIGDLATLVMLETRLTARSRLLEWSEFPVADDADPADPAVRAAVDGWLREVVGDPSRQLLNDAQHGFVADALNASTAAGKPWQLFGNQVMLAPVRSPDWTEVVGFWAGGLPGYVRGRIKSDPLAWGYFQRSRFGVPLGLDSWDGFPADRARLLRTCREADARVVTFTGDTHSFWANTVRDDAGVLGAEFGVTGATSPSAFRGLRAPGVNAGRAVERVNPDVLLNDPYANGYIVADITPQAVRAAFWAVDTVRRRDPRARVAHRFEMRRDDEGEGLLRPLSV